MCIEVEVWNIVPCILSGYEETSNQQFYDKKCCPCREARLFCGNKCLLKTSNSDVEGWDHRYCEVVAGSWCVVEMLKCWRIGKRCDDDVMWRCYEWRDEEENKNRFFLKRAKNGYTRGNFVLEERWKE